MPDPLADRLSRFTPDAGGLDRDGLLFAAGCASARPNRAWKALAALLAVAQALSLVLLWPRPVPPPDGPAALPPAEVAPPPSAPESPESGPLLVGRNYPDPFADPPRLPEDGLVPDPPPLRALASAATFPLD